MTAVMVTLGVLWLAVSIWDVLHYPHIPRWTGRRP